MSTRSHWMVVTLTDSRLQRLAIAQQQAGQVSVVEPDQPQPKTVRRFSCWMGVDIPRHYQSIGDIAEAVYALVPAGVWDEVEILLKAGEGGTWQSAFDSHPLALSGPGKLQALIDEGQAFGLRVTPYIVVRGKFDWIPYEQLMVGQCVQTAGRCILNVEPGAQYIDARLLNADNVRNYLSGCNVPPETLEVCMIPRQAQVNEIGGAACVQAWTDPELVGGASWECYGISAPGYGVTSLQVDAAIPRLDGWGVPEALEYRIPVCQRDERDSWAQTIWCAAGMQLWHSDGN